MPYVKVNIPKPTMLMPGIGGNMRDKITVFDFDDVTGGLTRDSLGIVITGPVTFKAGAYAILIYGTQDTIKTSAESQGDTDAEGVIQSVEFAHPGNLQAIKEFRSNWLGKSVGIIIEKCSDGSRLMYGAPCSPLRLAHKSEWDKDKNTSVMTFKSAQKGPDVADYLGTVTYDTVKGTAAAGATTVDVGNGSGEYQLTSGTSSAAAITGLTNPADQTVYTLLGSGGTWPSTIATGGNFILASGNGWTASAGAKLQLRAFKDGASTFKFIELSRL